MMASDGRSKCAKQMSITFTLPISCQICLGKVKQPVLCPNLHVFCHLCLEIWLNRNSQCPACRVDIGPDNPVRHIIGGQVEDEGCEKKSTPDFRRARFDLLYQEYEDQLDQMKKENIVLTTENNILIAQMKDIEDKNDNHKNKRDDEPSSSANLLHMSDGPTLLLLTKKLHEAQKLYSTIKARMSELKKENCKMKDENVHLTRENENLRLEIAQRSPKKFGRYTVATLETRIAEQEKEIWQLKKALECSDSYIEELQRKHEMPHSKGEEIKQEVEASLASKARFKFNLGPKHSADENLLLKDKVSQTNKHCKVLFGQTVHKEEDNYVNKKTDASSADFSSRSSQKQHFSKITNKIHEDIPEIDAETLFKQSNSRTRATSRHAETDLTAHDHTESGAGASEPEFPEKRNDNVGFRERNPKKVHFNISEKSSDISSFDLDMPSPTSSTLISDSLSSTKKESAGSSQRPATQACMSWNFDNPVKIDNNPTSNFDGKVLNLMPKKTVSLDSKSSKVVLPCNPQTSATSKKSKQIQGKAKKIKSSTVFKSTEQGSEDTNESSHLSVPDITTEEMVDNLSDTNDDTENADDDFDTSMTPEFTYCLKVMNQAEKKISLPASKASSSTEIPFPVQSAPGSSITTGPVYQAPRTSCAPPADPNIPKPSSFLQYFPSSTKSIQHQFAPSGSLPSSWEQQFYNSLRVNPYKYTTPNKPRDFPVNIDHNSHNDHKNDAGFGNKQEIYSLDINPVKESATRIDFKFSDPIKVGLSSSNKPFNPYSFYNHTDSVHGRNVFNPSSINLHTPSTSTISTSFPATSSRYSFPLSASSGYNFTPLTSSSGYNFTPLTSSSGYNFSPSTSSGYNFTPFTSTGYNFLPSTSTSSGYNVPPSTSTSSTYNFLPSTSSVYYVPPSTSTSSAYNFLPSTSSGYSFLPSTSTSSGYNFTVSTSKSNNSSSILTSSSAALSSPSDLSLPVAQTSKHASSFSSSPLELPSSSSRCTHQDDNAVSISLSNSELEWPEEQ